MHGVVRPCGAADAGGIFSGVSDTRATSTAFDGLEARLERALAPRYQLLRQLGKGGMGTVFLAREPSLRRLVAVKVLSPELAPDVEAHVRFEREAQAVAALAHPNVVGIYGVGQLDDGMPYFVMQYVEGRSLADRLEVDGALPIAEARRVVAEVASALAAAHAKGIVHRDIKPANVLQDAQSGRVLVTDFGLAAVNRSSTELGALNVTQTGMRVGTPLYMSPEQLAAEPPTDRTDVYALGLLAFELVVGTGPFSAKSPSELIAAHLRDVPPRLATKRTDVDPELDALVAASLEKDPAKRPSAQDIAQRLAPSGVAVLEWPPPGLEDWLGAAWPQGRWLFWSAGLMTMALALLLGLGIRLVDVGNAGFGSVLIVVVALGGVAAVLRLRLALETLRGMSHAVRSGYAWGTLLDVACDPRGDTGALIAGTRRYAALDANTRSVLRGGRRWAGSLAVLAPAVAPVLVGAWMVLGSVLGWSPQSVALLAVAPLALAELLRIAAWAAERAAAGRWRGDAAVATPSTLGVEAQQWYGSLARVTGERGGGQSARTGFATWSGAVLIAAVLLSLALVAPMLLVPARAAFLAELSFGDAASTVGAEREARAYDRLAPALDSAISPSRAGALLHDVLAVGNLPGAVASPLVRPQPALPSLPRPDSTSPLRPPPGVAVLLEADSLWSRLRAGVTAPELAYLESVARHPAWASFDSIARAPFVDVLAGMYGTPLPSGLTADGVRGPSISAIRALMAANAARAAYFAARGDGDSARAALRAGFGFARAITGVWDYFPASTGYTMVLVARRSLERYSVVQPNADGDALAALRDSLARPRSIFESMQLNSARRGIGETARARAIRDLRNPLLPVAFKFGQLQSLAMSQCTTLSEALFGPGPDLRDAFRYAEDSVARSEAERQLVRLTLRLPESYVDEAWREPGAPIQSIGKWLALSARTIGARRLEGCAHLIGSRATD
jgi:hypothetical protein